MLDLKLVREKSGEVETAIRARGGRHLETLKQLLEADEKRRKALKVAEELRAKKNALSGEVGKAKAAKDEARAQALMKESEALKEALRGADEEAKKADETAARLALELPNVPYPTTPLGRGPEENQVVREYGEARKGEGLLLHGDIGQALGILDFEAGAKLSGARFAVLRGAGARLERALISFMLDVHTKIHGYKEVWTPFLVTGESMTGTGQLPKFGEELYKCAEDDLYLIPTAEVPLTNLHRGDTLPAESLPRKYVAYTPCFRREAGSYGKDTKGLIRNHQFNKVELVTLAHPDSSDDLLEALTGHAESILQTLGLAYRVMALCTGDLGFAAAKTYDLEVWMPGEDRWREISSCSNFTDFQARRLNLRYRDVKGKGGLVHTLNGSALAVGRTFAAILETYQEPDGTVRVPDALRPYLGQDRIMKEV